MEIKGKTEDMEETDRETEEPEADPSEGDSPREPEEGPGEGEENMDTGADDQDKDTANHAEEHSEEEEAAAEEEEDDDRTATDRGGESGASPADQGLQPQVLWMWSSPCIKRKHFFISSRIFPKIFLHYYSLLTSLLHTTPPLL